jgi:uncharacterized membrane protein
MEENSANWKNSHMQTIFMIWLIFGVFASIVVIAALRLSSQKSQEDSLSESYDDWEATKQAKEIFQPQTEQQ